MKTVLYSALIALIAIPAVAQNASTQEGNVALEQCYSRCADVFQYPKNSDRADINWLYDYALAARSGVASPDEVTRAIEEFEPFWCAAFQNEVRVLAACHVGCRDLELIYPNSSTEVRSTFMNPYTTLRDEMVGYGLWVSYANSPKFGTPEFEEACDNFWNDTPQSQSSVE